MAQYEKHYDQNSTQYQQPQQPPSYTPQQPHIAHTYQSPGTMTQNEKPHNYSHPHIHNHGQTQPQTYHQDRDHDLKPSKPSSKWAFGLFDCFSPLSICCISCWCPCYMFGKTYERNKTGAKDASGFNGMCIAYCATLYCGCAPILQCMQRQNSREKNGIDGGCFGDFCSSCCCACCALVQEEKESLVRVTGVDPVTGTMYQPVPQMTYP